MPLEERAGGREVAGSSKVPEFTPRQGTLLVVKQIEEWQD